MKVDATHVEVALSPEHKATIKAGGINIAGIMAKLESLAESLGQSVCQAAPTLEKMLPMMPFLSPEETAAIIAVLNVMCPAS